MLGIGITTWWPSFQGGGSSEPTWSELMLASYLSIHGEDNFTEDDKASILSRLEEEYVINTFGEDGQDKETCDFFIWLKHINTETALTARTLSKTGDTMRWNYGGGNIYSTNNITAATCDGSISCTSTDGFSGFDLVYFHANNFSGCAPNPIFFTNARRYWIDTNDFDNDITNWEIPTNLQQFRAYTNQLTGIAPDLNSGSLLTMYSISGNKLTGIALETFTLSITSIDFYENKITTPHFDTLVENLNTFYTANAPTGNLTLRLDHPQQGGISGGSDNVDLIGIQTAFTNASKTLTPTYNQAFTKPYLIFTFDDGREDQYTLARPLFNSASKKAVFSIDTGAVGNAGIMTWANIQQLNSDGHELACHSDNSDSLTLFTKSEIETKLGNVNTAFTTNGLATPTDHVYPNGAQNATVIDAVDGLRNMGVKVGSGVSITANTNKKDTDLYLLSRFFMDGYLVNDEKYAELLASVQFCIDNNYCCILMGHEVVDEVTATKINVDYLSDLINYTVDNSIDVYTLDEFYTDITP